MPTIVHAADLHVDSPLAGLDRYEGAPVDVLRHATRKAFARLVAFSIAERADLLLLAGDLFDGTWRDFGTGLFFAKELAKLRDVGTKVIFVRGNHDAESVVTTSLRFADHVSELSTTGPETRLFPDLGVAVHGQGYRMRATRDDLAHGFPQRHAGLFNVGLLHTSLDGRPRHEPYAPSRLPTLLDKGYDYWALGHVHTREVVHEAPFVVFPGNLQGRHVHEQGAKGATKILVDSKGSATISHHPLDVVRWDHLRISLDDAANVDDVLERATLALDEAITRADGRPLATRVTIAGAAREGSSLSRDPRRVEDAVRLFVASEHGARVFVEKIVVAPTTRATAASVALTVTPAELDEERVALAADLEELERKMPTFARSRFHDLRDELLSSAMARAEVEVSTATGSVEEADEP